MATGKGNSLVQVSDEGSGTLHSGTHLWASSGWSNSPERFPIISSTVLLNHLMKTGKQLPGSGYDRCTETS